MVGKKDAEPRRSRRRVRDRARKGRRVKADELRDFCRQKGLAQWKVPREIHVVSDLPRSPTGKVLKRELPQPSRLSLLRNSWPAAARK